MDLGCYPVHWLRARFPGPPEVTAAKATPNPAGAGLSIEAELEFGGVTAVVRASMVDGVPLDSPLPTEGDDPIGNLAVIDAIHAAAGFERPWT